MASRKRSAVWSYFEDGEDPNKALCLVCADKIQHCGNTSNLLKHLRSKHQAQFADVEAKKKLPEVAAAAAAAAAAALQQHGVPVGADTAGYPEMLDSGSGEEDLRGEQFRGEEAVSRAEQSGAGETCYLSATASKKRSAVWTYYQDDEDGNKALCLICLENIQHRRNTSNLLKHLRKRHPAEYADVEDRSKRLRPSEEGALALPHCAFKAPPAFPSPCRGTAKYPDILEVITVGQSEQDQMRRALEQEVRVLERERELTEQLRRAQEQEARALEQQRTLTEQLRRAQEEEMRRARELEARVLQRERQAIEQLRRAQEQESRALEREREALERLRCELEQERRALRRRRGMGDAAEQDEPVAPKDVAKTEARAQVTLDLENCVMEPEVTT